MYSQFAISPALTISPKPSTMCVCGVIGYAQITCGRHSATASATARDPSVCLSIDHLLAPLRAGEGLASGEHVFLGVRPRKFLPNGGGDRIERNDPGDRRERAKERHVRHGATYVLYGKLRRGDGPQPI